MTKKKQTAFQCLLSSFAESHELKRKLDPEAKLNLSFFLWFREEHFIIYASVKQTISVVEWLRE